MAYQRPVSPERGVFLLGPQPLDVLWLLMGWMDLQMSGPGGAREPRERQLKDQERVVSHVAPELTVWKPSRPSMTRQAPKVPPSPVGR